VRVLARSRAVNIGLVILALLSVCAAVWTRRLPTAEEQEVRRRHLLAVFRHDDVQQLSVRHGSRESVLVRHEHAPREMAENSGGSAAEEPPPPEDEWSLIKPFETDADQLPVEKLLGTLQYATWEREVLDPLHNGAEPGAAGGMLSEREVGVVMGSLSYKLSLGADAVSPPGARYVEVKSGNADSHVYVIKKRLVDELFVDADAFRGRQIVPYQKSSVDRLTLSSAAGVRRLRRVGGEFHFDGMQDSQRVDRVALDRIFTALSRAAADPFLDVAVAEAALRMDASVRVSLWPVATDRPEASLEFGGVCPGEPDKTVALRHLPEPLAGCVEHGVLLALREPATALVDHSLFGFAADEVDTVQITEGDQVLEFARGGDGFVLRQPRSLELDPEAARDRLSRIMEIQGELLMDKAKPANAAQFSAASVRVESSSQPGDEERVKENIRLSAPGGDGSRRVFREADGAVLLISAESALALHADATLLKEHQVFDYAIRDVRGVQVTHGPLKQTLKRSPEGALSLIEPRGVDVDGGLALDLIDQLRTLRALRWVSDSASKAFGLDKPRALVHFSVQVDGRDIERTLTLGASAPGGYYASVDRDPGVFVVERSIDRTLATWLLDRSVFSAERDSVVELSLDAEQRGRVVLRRVAGQLTVQKGSVDFDPSRIDALLDSIETLRPEAAVHLGAALPGEGLRRPILTGIIKRQSPANVGMPPIRFSVGSRDSFQDASIYYARQGSVNATYALPRQQVQRLLDLF
jgi:uncharacterized protein DUF4340